MGTAGRLYRKVAPSLPEGARDALDGLRTRKFEVIERRRWQRADAALSAYLASRGGNFVQPVDPGPPVDP